MAETQNLIARIEGDELVIRCGLATLATAAENYPEMFEYPRNQWPPFARVTDRDEFAKEVVRSLNHEEEDGSGPLTNLFDKAINHAIENGALGIDLRLRCEACKGTGNIGIGDGDFDSCVRCEGKGSIEGFEVND